VIGAAVVFGQITFDFDMEMYSIAAGSWLTAIAGLTMLGCVSLVLVGRMQTVYMSFIGELEGLNKALQEKNNELERKADERRRAEELLYGISEAVFAVDHDLNITLFNNSSKLFSCSKQT